MIRAGFLNVWNESAVAERPYIGVTHYLECRRDNDFSVLLGQIDLVQSRTGRSPCSPNQGNARDDSAIAERHLAGANSRNLAPRMDFNTAGAQLRGRIASEF